ARRPRWPDPLAALIAHFTTRPLLQPVPAGLPRLPDHLAGAAASNHFFTFTWNPAFASAFTNSSASNSPVTSNVVSFGLAVSPVTPLTSLTVDLMALQQAGQQLWTPVRVSVFTLPLVAPLSSLMARSLLPVSPWNPAAARASSAFWAAASSLAVRVTVLAFWSHLPWTPSTFFNVSATVLMHAGQQRCTPLSSTVVSALAVAARPSIRARLATGTNCDRFIFSPW